MQTEIYRNTFKGCSRLKKITLPSNILSVGDCAFYGCTSLEWVDLNVGVKFIGTSAFCGDFRLSYVDRLNGSVSYNAANTFDIVANYAFAGTALPSANLSLRSSAIQTFWGDGCF